MSSATMRRRGVGWSVVGLTALLACDRAPAPAPVATAFATAESPRSGEGAAPQPSQSPASPSAVPHPPEVAPVPSTRPGGKQASSAPSPSVSANVAPVASATAATAPALPAPSATAAAEITSPQVGAATFSVWMAGAGRYKAGQLGVAQVVLVARGGFHCNPQYPYRLKLGAPPAGVTYPEPVVRKESMSVAPERSVMTVPFVASAPGDARIGGTFSFSVCSDATCQIESREVALTVHVD